MNGETMLKIGYSYAICILGKPTAWLIIVYVIHQQHERKRNYFGRD